VGVPREEYFHRFLSGQSFKISGGKEWEGRGEENRKATLQGRKAIASEYRHTFGIRT